MQVTCCVSEFWLTTSYEELEVTEMAPGQDTTTWFYKINTQIFSPA